MSRSRRPARRRRQAMIDAELVSWLEGLAQGLETGFNGAVNEVLRVGMGKINRDRLAAELDCYEMDRFDRLLDAENVRLFLEEHTPRDFETFVHESMIEDAREVGLKAALDPGSGKHMFQVTDIETGERSVVDPVVLISMIENRKDDMGRTP